MGRRRYSSRSTAEDCWSISVSFLHKNDFFSGLKSGNIIWTNWAGGELGKIGIVVSTCDLVKEQMNIRLSYNITDRGTGEKTDYNYEVGLITTSCNFGGNRYWFRCPIAGCWKRVGKLYLPPTGMYFGCRHCYDLTYRSCRNSHSWGYRFAHSFGLTPGQMGKLIRGE